MQPRAILIALFALLLLDLLNDVRRPTSSNPFGLVTLTQRSRFTRSALQSEHTARLV